MRYTPAQREAIGAVAVGRVVKELAYDEVGAYWVMTFYDDTELCFRLMAEL